MSTAALFTTAKTWKQAKCPSADDKMCSIHTLEHDSALKKEGNSDTCYAEDDLEDVMLSEASQSQKDKSCVLPQYEVPRADKSMETESRLVGAGGWSGGMGS